MHNTRFKKAYDNRSFLNQWFGASLSGQSAIFADIHYLNDVDYRIRLAAIKVLHKIDENKAVVFK